MEDKAVLFCASLTPSTGNLTSAKRLSSMFRELGLGVDLIDCHDDLDIISTDTSIVPYNAVVGIHAVRSAKTLLDFKAIPSIVILGGTDANVHSHDETLQLIIRDVILSADVIIAFTPFMRDGILNGMRPMLSNEQYGEISSKVHIIPQGLSIPPFLKDGFSCDEVWNALNIQHGKHRVYTLVCGLRPVKDPLFLIPYFAERSSEEYPPQLLIIGPRLCEDTAIKVEKAASQHSNIHLLAPFKHDRLMQLITCSDCVLNSSVAEGQASSILEAMLVQTPVIARRNCGNESLIKHEHSGLLFSTIEEFATCVESLEKCPGLKEKLIKNGKALVAAEHSERTEKELYRRILKKLDII
eukprot:TRINITY_DN1174_c0_g2_i1.p1 TRINITY_DN1174_c0_g2~~TRINITY_DN1174_c0_g2_i1.p1  ORF type:complete len:355 (+),score=94.10 TRINITY_DN1174_c0_g2_i1:144-1208(+)